MYFTFGAKIQMIKNYFFRESLVECFAKTLKCCTCGKLNVDENIQKRQETPSPKKHYITPSGGIPKSETGLNYIPRTPKPLKSISSEAELKVPQIKIDGNSLNSGINPSNGSLPYGLNPLPSRPQTISEDTIEKDENHPATAPPQGSEILTTVNLQKY